MRAYASLLVGIVMVGVVIGLRVPDAPARPTAVTENRGVDTAAWASTDSDHFTTPATTTRPGEPMLVPGQSLDLQRAGDSHFYADAQVNYQPVRMLVDTGASTVALTVGDAQRLGLPVNPDAFEVVGSGASGPTRGQVVMLNDVSLGGHHVSGVQAVVLEGLGQSLLGQSFLGHLDQVQITGDTMTLR